MTDEWDRRTLTTILERFYCVGVIGQKRYLFDPSGIYYVPEVSEHSEFHDYVWSLPMTTSPSVFGMNENADIIKDQQETALMLTSILATQVSVFPNDTRFLSRVKHHRVSNCFIAQTIEGVKVGNFEIKVRI